VKPVLVVFLSLGVSNFHIVECISIFFHPPLYPNSQFCVRWRILFCTDFLTSSFLICLSAFLIWSNLVQHLTVRELYLVNLAGGGLSLCDIVVGVIDCASWYLNKLV
jgi:hypothetical protein